MLPSLLQAKTQTSTVTDLLPEESYFREYMGLWEHTEPPRSFILFSALSALGAAIGREVYFDHDPHKLYPMLNLLLVGPSGTGKSTSIFMALNNLVKTLPKGTQPQLILGAATPEKLHDDLAENSKAIVFASELANFFTRQKYMEGMIPYITELFDYNDVMERRTKAGGIIEVINPTATLMGGSTVDWLQGQLPDTATSGGFLARFLIVKDEFKYQRVANPKRAMGTPSQKAELDSRKDATFNRFLDLLRIHTGEIDFEDYEASDTYGTWYQTFQPDAGHLAPFSARAGEFVLRLSILIAISCQSNNIRTQDVNAGIRLYEYATRGLQEVVVPFTPQGKLLNKILEVVATGTASQGMLRRAMRNYISSQEADKLTESLIQSGDLRWTPDHKLERVWRPNE